MEGRCSTCAERMSMGRPLVNGRSRCARSARAVSPDFGTGPASFVAHKRSNKMGKLRTNKAVGDLQGKVGRLIYHLVADTAVANVRVVIRGADRKVPPRAWYPIT